MLTIWKTINNERDKTMAFNREKLEQIANARSAENIRRAEERKQNREWMRMSQDIALGIHRHLRLTNTTQRDFAERLGVSPAYVGKLLKGRENLTLETIWKIQEVLGITFFQSPYRYILPETEKSIVAEEINIP